MEGGELIIMFILAKYEAIVTLPCFNYLMALS